MAQETSSPKLDLYVVSFTHWDREWYYSFETFRQMFVEIMDNIIKTLETDKEFKVFHLDGQTAQIGDYLEIKPYNRKRVQKLIKEKRLIIGPHYIQSDEYLASGEAQIRNLLIGFKDCREIGTKPMKIGFILDQFGHCSQIPQILNGFGIKRAALGRGIKDSPDLKNAFYWKSPDGSKCLTSFLNQWYNNFQRAPKKPEDAISLLNKVIDGQKNKIIGKSVLLMNGVDHLDIQTELPKILKEIRENGYEHNLIHCNAEEFFSALENEMKSLSQKPQFTGELRNGNEFNILSGTLSARIYLKQMNTIIGRKFEKVLEPIGSLADIFNPKTYPADSINYAWRLYIQNQPHDSICGCSIDETHYQMMSRFHRVRDVIKYNIVKIGESVAYQIKFDAEKNPNAEQILLFWNPTAHQSERTAEIVLEFPVLNENQAWQSIKIYPVDKPENPLDIKILSIDKIIRLYTHIKRLPITAPVHQYRIIADISGIPPLGYKAFIVSREGGLEPILKSVKEYHSEEAVMENKNLKITIHNDGTFNIIEKNNGKVFENLHYFSDSGDEGHEYIYMPPANNEIIETKNKKAQIFCTEKNDLRQIFKIVHNLEIPEGADFVSGCRKPFKIKHTIETYLILEKNSKVLRIRTHILNQSKNHRLRAVFPILLNKEKCYAETPFDAVERKSDNNSKTECSGEPNSGFIAVKNNEKGLAIITDGLQEYYYDGESKKLSVTLLRAVGSLGQAPQPEMKEKIEDYNTYDSQCIGECISNYGIYVYNGNEGIEIIKKEADKFLNNLDSFVSLIHYDEFIKGTKREEFSHNYFDPAYEEMFPYKRNLPAEKSLIKIDNPAVIFSAFKRCEDSESEYILRVYNITGKPQETQIQLCKNIHSIYAADMAERPKSPIKFNDDKIDLKLKPKQILTCRISFENQYDSARF